MEARKIGQSWNIIVFGCLAWIEDGVGEVGLEDKEREQTNIPTPAPAVNINNRVLYNFFLG